MNEMTAQPIYKSGTNGAAVLLLHGFTGEPAHMQGIANHLYDMGFTVFAPVLAGHEKTHLELAQTTWRDWYGSAEKSFWELKKKSDKVFVVGLSMGGLLTLKLAIDHPQDIAAIAGLAVPFRLARWVHFLLPVVSRAPVRWFYRHQKKTELDVKDPTQQEKMSDIAKMPIACIHSITELQKIIKKDLAKITIPTLLLHGPGDSTAPFVSMAKIAKNLGTKEVETVTLENSYHMLTLDYDKDIVAQKVGEFFLRFLK